MIGLYIFLALLVLFILALFIVYTMVFYSPHKNQNNVYNIPKGEQYEARFKEMRKIVDDFMPYDYEPVEITSSSKLKLYGKYYHKKDGAPLVICFHGYRSTSLRDFSGISLTYFKHDINVLIVDQRAHGKSQGHTITFGIKERYDCLDWINYANDRFGKGTKIVLCGISMGASTVLMSLSLNLPSNVVAVMVDCPYSTPKDIIKKVCGDLKVSAKIVYPLIYLSALIFGRFKLDEVTAIDAVKDAKIPIIIVHGDDDRLVPIEMSRLIKQSNTKYVELHEFEGAGHGISYVQDHKRYIKLAEEFLYKHVL